MRDSLCWEEFGECKVIISLVVHLYNILGLVLLDQLYFKTRTCQNLSPEVQTDHGKFFGVYE